MKPSDLIFLGLVVTIVFSSCEKSKEEYIKGGLIEKAELNLTQSWDLQ